MIGKMSDSREAEMAHLMSVLRELEGQQACLVVADGSRIDDCGLISVGRGRVDTVWVVIDGRDVFIPCEDVIDAWQFSTPQRRQAA
jgi:hypothetical protein